MERIASFSVDHDLIVPGMYISRVDGDVVTYDLRTRRPNAGSYMDNVTMHTVEHMLATYLRNSAISGSVIYFGPMGCRTGFYLLVRAGISPDEVKTVLADALNKVLEHRGPVFGARRRECGNYRSLDLAKAQAECRAYLKVLEGQPAGDYSYPG